jgi:hypothetical protein
VTLFEDRDWTRLPARRNPDWRRRGIVSGIVLAAFSAAGVLLTVLPSSPLAALTSYSLSAETSQIADRIGFTDEGTDIFLATRPELLDSGDFRRACDDTPDGTDGEFSTVGCFYGFGEQFGRIAIFRPRDARLADQIVVTAAHEFLHAAYARLSVGEHARLDALLDARWSAIPADDPIRASLASSVGSVAENRPTEEFAYLGTEIADGVDPALEAYYARFFRDRGAVVAIHAADRALWNGLEDGYRAQSAAVTGQAQANADASAQLQADRARLDTERAEYNRQVAEYNARSPEARARIFVTESDGSVTNEPFGSYLAGRLAEFGTRQAENDARATRLAAAETAAAAARTEAERLAADLDALDAAAVPAAH